jgi:prefoldin subunit 5
VAAVDVKMSSDLKRLQRALEALSADLDAIEQRPHSLLRSAAANLETGRGDGLETFVNHFVFAVKRGVLR